MCKLPIVLLFVSILTIGGQKAAACRYTVREIGFSNLSQDIYNIVVLSEHKLQYEALLGKYHDQLKGSNIQISLLHPQEDKQHHYINKLKKYEIHDSGIVLIAPDDRSLNLSEHSLEEVINMVLNSPTSNLLKDGFHDLFAVVLLIDGESKEDNSSVLKYLEQNCKTINDIMPHMPKEVAKGPVIFNINKEQFEKEKVLLWALGYDLTNNGLGVFVLYGRGRIMGGEINSAQTLNDEVYTRLSMIGLDCECGLDRKWMLGRQIPMMWNEQNRQTLTNELGFDVDNPMILAEMTRILAKEATRNSNVSVIVGPEEIDLNKMFATDGDEVSQEKEYNLYRKYGIYFGITVLIIVLIGFMLYRRNMK